MKQFVLLDRDGTLVVDRHYLGDPEGVQLLPNSAAGLRAMRELGLGLIVASNQSGIARGYFDRKMVDAVNARMTELLATEAVALDDLVICPHGPEDGCRCRKPGTGMAEDAAARWGFDPVKCFVIGDRATDVEFGRNLGAVTILLGPGAFPRCEARTKKPRRGWVVRTGRRERRWRARRLD